MFQGERKLGGFVLLTNSLSCPAAETGSEGELASAKCRQEEKEGSAAELLPTVLDERC